MPVSQAFLEMVRELLAPLGAVSARRMFGGAGIYCDGTMFALVEDDVLYFKANDATKARYVCQGMTPFTFQGQTRPVETSYWRAPDRLYDEPHDMLEFAREALSVAATKTAHNRAPAGKPKSRTAAATKSRSKSEF